MTSSPQLTLQGARIPASAPDPTLIAILRTAGIHRDIAERLAAAAANRMQFMPADIKSAYLAQLTEQRHHDETHRLSSARQELTARAKT